MQMMERLEDRRLMAAPTVTVGKQWLHLSHWDISESPWNTIFDDQTHQFDYAGVGNTHINKETDAFNGGSRAFNRHAEVPIAAYFSPNNGGIGRTYVEAHVRMINNSNTTDTDTMTMTVNGESGTHVEPQSSAGLYGISVIGDFLGSSDGDVVIEFDGSGGEGGTGPGADTWTVCDEDVWVEVGTNFSNHVRVTLANCADPYFNVTYTMTWDHNTDRFEDIAPGYEYSLTCTQAGNGEIDIAFGGYITWTGGFNDIGHYIGEVGTGLGGMQDAYITVDFTP